MDNELARRVFSCIDNTTLNATSSVAAALWGRIMGQVPGVTGGEYADMPEDVIRQNGAGNTGHFSFAFYNDKFFYRQCILLQHR